ncbi:MAG: response regulator, partial [Phycisphaerales bacterium]|nr:response regulator [Phycisphaerales bacterium]
WLDSGPSDPSAQLVQMMDGTIGLESEPGKGTTFRFTARLGVSHEPVPDTRAGLAALRHLPVLVVDDNQTNRDIMEAILDHWSLRPTVVSGADSAETALQHAAAEGEPFRLVLLDGMMPGRDGFDLAQAILDDPSVPRPRMIMVSSAAQASDAQRCREVGIDRYLTKPVVHSDLSEAIIDVMGVVSARGRAAGEDADGETNGRGRLRILLAEDGLVNQKVAVVLLGKLGHDVTVVDNGKRALEAVDAEPFDLVLMDMQMPIMDGLEATRQIRERERSTGRHLPIVAMTAAAMKGDRERCLDAGMDAYLSKPFQQREVVAVLESFVTGPV